MGERRGRERRERGIRRRKKGEGEEDNQMCWVWQVSLYDHTHPVTPAFTPPSHPENQPCMSVWVSVYLKTLTYGQTGLVSGGVSSLVFPSVRLVSDH